MLEFLHTLMEMDENQKNPNGITFVDFNSSNGPIRKYSKEFTPYDIPMNASTKLLLNALHH